MTCTAGMTKLSESLCLDLSYTLTGDVKFLTNLLECTCASVIKTETKLDYVCLTGSKGVKLSFYYLTENGCGRRISGSGGILPQARS